MQPPPADAPANTAAATALPAGERASDDMRLAPLYAEHAHKRARARKHARKHAQCVRRCCTFQATRAGAALRATALRTLPTDAARGAVLAARCAPSLHGIRPFDCVTAVSVNAVSACV